MARIGKVALVTGAAQAPQEMHQPWDLLEAIRFLLRLSPAGRVRGLVLECRASLA